MLCVSYTMRMAKTEIQFQMFRTKMHCISLAHRQVDQTCIRIIHSKFIGNIAIWLFSENVNPLGGPQLKHELFCCTNPAKFWWANVQSNSDGSPKLNHQNLIGSAPQNNSCPGSSPGSSPTPSHPSHFLMVKTRFKLQCKSNQILVD